MSTASRFCGGNHVGAGSMHKPMSVGAVLAAIVLASFGLGPAVLAKDEQVVTTPPTNSSRCTEHPFSIDLEVNNVRRAKGLITVDLHDDNPAGFLNKTGLVDRVRTPAEKDVTRICIPVEQPGVYAIALYHDKDANQKFNKNFLGIPSEPFGISNNPRIGLKAPPHKAAAFDVQGPATPVSIRLRGS